MGHGCCMREKGRGRPTWRRNGCILWSQSFLLSRGAGFTRWSSLAATDVDGKYRTAHHRSKNMSISFIGLSIWWPFVQKLSCALLPKGCGMPGIEKHTQSSVSLLDHAVGNTKQIVLNIPVDVDFLCLLLALSISLYTYAYNIVYIWKWCTHLWIHLSLYIYISIYKVYN